MQQNDMNMAGLTEEGSESQPYPKYVSSHIRSGDRVAAITANFQATTSMVRKLNHRFKHFLAMNMWAAWNSEIILR